MTDFESVLRARLADAAAAAPEFRGFTASAPPARKRRSPRPFLAAAAAVALVVGAGAWWAVSRDDHTGGAVTCPAELVLDGRTYVGRGPVVRVPRPGPRLGTATPAPCKDDRAAGPVEAFTVPGVPATEAILTDDGIWLAKDLTAVPAAIRQLDAPVTCSGAGATRVVGRLTGVDAAPVSQDYAFKAPYSAQLVVTEGTGLPLDVYRSVTIDVTVTTSTVAGEDRELIRAALGGGRLVAAELRCDGTRFEAVSLALAG